MAKHTPTSPQSTEPDVLLSQAMESDVSNVEKIDGEKNDIQPTQEDSVNTVETLTTEQEKISPTKQEEYNVKNETNTETVIIKKSGTGIALLALLIALGLGGTGYYFGQQQIDDFQQKITALEQKLADQPVITSVEPVNFDTERQQLTELIAANKTTQEKLHLVEQELSIKQQTLSSLQNQINSINSQAKPQQPNDWLLSEADFLLNNALRKLILDNDIDTALALLKLADEALEKTTDPRVVSVRTALNADLKQLLSISSVDQNAVMQRLSQLTNQLDELEVLNVNFEANTENTKLTNSLDDWKENAEKSAVSFLNHFIRIKPRSINDKALLAPNQDIYLRENIRLRLQIAILAVPRQQDELYKQSLDAVASWIRSYFNTQTQGVQDFLKSIDELAEQSIYIDVPNQLTSLNALDKLLERQSQAVQKIEISVDKALHDSPAQPSEPTTQQ